MRGIFAFTAVYSSKEANLFLRFSVLLSTHDTKKMAHIDLIIDLIIDLRIIDLIK